MFRSSSFLLLTLTASYVFSAEWCLFSGNISRILEKYGSNEERVVKRNVDFVSHYKWPNGRIPYTIDMKSFTRGKSDPHKAKGKVEKLVSEAIEEIHKKACVRFVPRTNERIHVEIIHEDEACGYVYLKGDKGYRRHMVLLNTDWCFVVGIVLHEFGHVTGLRHEHIRPDRDDYLIVNYENIEEDSIQAFHKNDCSNVTLYTLFNLDSIMMYDGTQGAKSTKVKSIEARSGKRIIAAEFKKEIRKSDAENINMAYGCLHYVDP